MELPDHHPFRSAKAKEEYLALYDRMAARWPVASQTRLVETSHGQTFVRISGSADAPPLVLLPGFGANSLMWIPNVEELSRQFRTYAVDNIYDNGRSIYTRPLASAKDFVSWMDELFTALAVKGRPVQEAERMFEEFHRMVTSGVEDGVEESLGKLAVFCGVREFPSRVKCASLAWHTLHAALEAKGGTASTE